MFRGWRRVFRLDAGPQRVERDVDEEIAFHVAMRERRLIDAGLAPDAAHQEALQRFGDLVSVRAECLTIDHDRERDMRRTQIFESLRQDVTYAVRALRHRPGFTAVALLILALGIGANASVFSLIDALLLRALPVPGASQLVAIGNPERTGGVSDGSPRTDLLSYPLYRDVRENAHRLSGVFASGRAERLDVFVPSDSAGAPRSAAAAEHPRGRYVSGNYFAVLQVRAALGRTFTADDDRVPGGDPMVVISDRYWRTRFAGERGAVGRTMVIDGTPMTIIGVMPPSFFGDIVGAREDVWLPLMMQPVLMPHSPRLDDRGVSWLLLMGRLAPGATLAQARTEARGIVERSILANAGNDAASLKRDLQANPLSVASGAQGFSPNRGANGQALFILMAAVGLVLLVVCANLANLMMARAAARGREISVRLALGAGRARLVQQLLTESLLLAVAGGAGSLLVANWGSALLLRLANGGGSPMPIDVSINGHLLAFCTGASVLTAVLFGLAPAVRATRVELTSALRAQGRGVAGTGSAPGRVPVARLLVAGQVALSMLLLVGTAMLVRSMQRLQQTGIGVAQDRLLLVEVDPNRSGYGGPRLAALARDLNERLARLPGVAAVTLSENGIFSGTESGTTFEAVEGFTSSQEDDRNAAYDDVGPGYFHAVGARLLRGRDFDARDNETGTKVVVINETMARFYFPGGDALGRHLTGERAVWEIVGVVADIEEQGLRDTPVRRAYFPFYQMAELPGAFNFEVRASDDPARLVTPVRQALKSADAALVVDDISPLTDLIRESIQRDRLVAQVVSFFGLLALVLAALGLYGVMSYTMIRRTNEFGLRMALGARSGQVVGLVLRDVLRLVGTGIVVGVPLTLAGTRLIRSQLFNVAAIDPPSIAVALAVLAASALLAGLLPALRASRVAPQEALRAE